MERLTDMDIGIDKYFSFVVLKSPFVKPHHAAEPHLPALTVRASTMPVGALRQNYAASLRVGWNASDT